MPLNLGVEVSKQCAKIDSFGEVLDRIRRRLHLRQDEMATRLLRSPSDVNRLIHNKLPKYLTVTEVHTMAKLLQCSDQELVELINAFICHLLYIHGTIDTDIN